MPDSTYIKIPQKHKFLNGYGLFVFFYFFHCYFIVIIYVMIQQRFRLLVHPFLGHHQTTPGGTEEH